ncbi:MAG: DUF4037 domain-containing protein [Lachnospiraceae bacterium]|nr:DUF4037 domain-containing protein [Lachnospiraceae bacterium]
MKGLELSEQYYLAYGKDMLETSFPGLLPLIAVGMAGPGSECLGFDDDVSADHDFGPGFTIFLPDESEVSRRAAFLLERAYMKLPEEFMGYRREKLSPAGGNRFGVVRRSDFFLASTGTADGFLSDNEWLSLPEQSLLEAVNGKLFYDGDGVMSAIRSHLSSMPEDVRLKKLAGALYVMGQAGSYNYKRIMLHNEAGSAVLSLAEFASEALHAVYLINHAYMPYYKWSFRGARGLGRFADDYSPADLASDLEAVLLDPSGAESRIKTVEERTVEAVLSYLKDSGFSVMPGRSTESSNPYRLRQGGEAFAESKDLGTLSMIVNNCVQDADLRNRSIFAGVNR